jgi:hypothetical protein
LLGGGTVGTADQGFANLGAGVNELVGVLMLNGVAQPGGTYGATGSGATHIMDEYFAGAGIISVPVAGLPGDFNGDGKVDAADYVIIRKQNSDITTGTGLANYTTWRTNFGNGGPGSGSGLNGGAVPEPCSLVLLLLGSVATASRRSRSRRAR